MADIAEFLTTSEAAEVIGCSDAHVRHMCLNGELPGRKTGHMWLIRRRDAEKIRDVEHDRGRPRKNSQKTA